VPTRRETLSQNAVFTRMWNFKQNYLFSVVKFLILHNKITPATSHLWLEAYYGSTTPSGLFLLPWIFQAKDRGYPLDSDPGQPKLLAKQTISSAVSPSYPFGAFALEALCGGQRSGSIFHSALLWRHCVVEGGHEASSTPLCSGGQSLHELSSTFPMNRCKSQNAE
jgi:hypothetical protein